MGALAGVSKRRVAGRLHRFMYAFDKSWKAHIDHVYAYVDVHVKRVLEEVALEGKKPESVDTTQERYVSLKWPKI